MRLQIVGKLISVGDVIKKESYKFQTIQISQSSFDRNTGEPLPPEIYEATIFNKKIDDLRAHLYVGRPMVAICYTRSIAREHDGKTFYNIALNCADLKKVPHD